MDLEELIRQAEELKVVNYDSPKVRLWETKAEDFVLHNYGDNYLKILKEALFFSQVIMSEEHGQSMHVGAMSKAIEFLESLKNEPRTERKTIEEKPALKDLNQQKPNYQDITISGGTVIFGDGNTVTQVEVKELIEALSAEIKEKVPSGEEKQSVLRSLKEITTNETFASVTGVLIGEILRRVTKP